MQAEMWKEGKYPSVEDIEDFCLSAREVMKVTIISFHNQVIYVCLLGFFMRREFATAPILIIILVFGTIIYANTGNRFKK